ncbi:MAG TPA: DEAD/DEAH box helicase family protein [Actinocatenispora sp.]
MPTDELPTRRFAGTWRRYQRLALDAFDADRAAGDHRFFAVLPPGSGKTLIGLEAARRIGRRTLVLTPNTAVQGQWATTWDERFVPAGRPCGTGRELAGAVNVLTYQSLAVLDRGEASARRAVVRDGGHRDLLELLHPNGRAVIDTARRLGPWTLVLDECHHLLATWGALVRAVVDALGETTALIGLTATPQRQLTTWQQSLHDDLFGHTDVEIPAPALVRAGTLAPYQELVYLTSPTAGEDTWLATEASRFADLRFELVERRPGTMPLLTWLHRRAVERTTGEADGPRGDWAGFEHAEPALARAVLRFAYAGMLPLPTGARLREPHRTEPDADDWVAVLADFCAGHLAASDHPDDAAALAAIRRVLPGLGYRLTVRGLRAGMSPVDRLCGLSEAKVAAAVHILEAEDAALGDRLRALVLTDHEQLSGRLPASLAESPMDARSGSARLAFATLAAAPVGTGLRPLLVTGQTFACPAKLADELVAYCRGEGYEVTTEPLEPGTVRITGLSPRRAVRLATGFLAAGRARVLVGTRALLGEGWDCPRLNVSIDLTTATTPTAVTQMRGRALRLSPDDPDKVADNWTVCCTTDAHPRGDADYLRLVRKHDAYVAPDADGTIISGIAHCDPALSPHTVPTADDALAVTARALARPAARAEARASWRIGADFAGTEVSTLRVRADRPLGTGARALPDAVLDPARPARRPGAATALTLGLAFVAAVLALAGQPLAAVAVPVVALAAFALATGRRRARLAAAPTALDQLAATVADALHDAGGADRGADAVRVVPGADGWLRCELSGVPVAQSRRYATAVDELLAPLADPRHLVGRRVVTVPAGRFGQLVWAGGTLLRLPVPGAVAWHAMPAWCAANAARRAAFLAAWQRHVGPAVSLAAASAEGQGVLAVFRGEDPFALTAQMRTVWR